MSFNELIGDSSTIATRGPFRVEARAGAPHKVLRRSCARGCGRGVRPDASPLVMASACAARALCACHECAFTEQVRVAVRSVSQWSPSGRSLSVPSPQCKQSKPSFETSHMHSHAKAEWRVTQAAREQAHREADERACQAARRADAAAATASSQRDSLKRGHEARQAVGTQGELPVRSRRCIGRVASIRAATRSHLRCAIGP